VVVPAHLVIGSLGREAASTARVPSARCRWRSEGHPTTAAAVARVRPVKSNGEDTGRLCVIREGSNTDILIGAGPSRLPTPATSGGSCASSPTSDPASTADGTCGQAKETDSIGGRRGSGRDGAVATARPGLRRRCRTSLRKPLRSVQADGAVPLCFVPADGSATWRRSDSLHVVTQTPGCARHVGHAHFRRSCRRRRRPCFPAPRMRAAVCRTLRGKTA
jgi:hypothetical protein